MTGLAIVALCVSGVALVLAFVAWIKTPDYLDDLMDLRKSEIHSLESKNRELGWKCAYANWRLAEALVEVEQLEKERSKEKKNDGQQKIILCRHTCKCKVRCNPTP